MSTSQSDSDDAATTATKVKPSTVSNEQIYQQRKLRWPVLMILLFWIASAAIGLLELPMFTGFLARSAVLLALALAFSIWWLVRGPLRLSFRFLVLGWAVAAGIVATLLMHRSVLAVSVFFLMLPILFTVWTVWLLLTRGSVTRTRLTGMLLIATLLSIPGTLVRMEGLRGDGQGDFHWRWSRSGEEQFALLGGGAIERKTKTEKLATERLVASAEDWIGFRGPQRDATVPGVKIVTTWDSSPPKLIWQTRVGPAWSSMAIVGEHLYTQEQRGETEVVSCFDANTGQPLWIHSDPVRFDDPLGGPGPRATPLFEDGRIYALGGKGRLNCLDAVTGAKRWSQDIVQSPTDALPTWGYSGSPLVMDGRVIAFAGGKSEKALLAYDADTGKLSWKAVAGLETYSSPHAVVLHGQPQVLMVGNEELAALEPASGKIIWKYKHTQSFGRPVIQPRLVGDSKILVSFLPDAGVSQLEITRQGESWNVTETWNSRQIKPDYSDFVHHGGYLYGFDGSIFCCVNLATGKRQWKGGRYGAGQVLLLTDQPLLLVMTEQGEIVLVEPNPEKHHEIARFQAIHGKTWNHPVIARGKLFVRNAEEMACYKL